MRAGSNKRPRKSKRALELEAMEAERDAAEAGKALFQRVTLTPAQFAQ